ncbi:hypothetical protein R70006_05034 [Paraburkholderia domus]|uniref:hypothetical protein n=1 Tax=Paraburkholderia domus TaxID=2793075 RepID=UPI001914A85F|nr:hypothetical protein [Paraburkholderia domus]MBK5051729.1 hypothetical protein [Burkholderia sp. R-70006]CAE6795077.1 hypothetical protein R70006_05034 [Paraburkholderia domus]
MTNTLRDQFIALLRLPAGADAKKLDRAMQARLIGLGHGQPCGRCGGSGNFSSNAIDGTRCYGCGGGGYVARKLSGELLSAVTVDVASGKLDGYLRELAERQAADKAVKLATGRVMKAWEDSGVSQSYDWEKSARGVQPHRDIADMVNRPMCDAYENVSRLSSRLEHISGYARAKTPEAREDLRSELQLLRPKLIEETEKALVLIAEKAKLIPVILERHKAATADQAPSYSEPDGP